MSKIKKNKIHQSAKRSAGKSNWSKKVLGVDKQSTSASSRAKVPKSSISKLSDSGSQSKKMDLGTTDGKKNTKEITKPSVSQSENDKRRDFIGKITIDPISEEVKTSYLDYAMSVIVARALPDVTDGLKPIHRRILYAMNTLSLNPEGKTRKSATIVGETLGKYHPHGDIAVYYSLVRMAQNFSLRYPLIIGQGNWGSIDGDSPAAQRYTECKLSPIAKALLTDLDKETVEFAPNYDGTLTEPKTLPAKIPNLIINGSMGIAVGMATNIPPHNLGEVCEALIYFIDHPQATIKDLIKFIPGPDFPTGGLIFGTKELEEIYKSGRGKIVMRARTEIIETKPDHWQIIITEIPYQVNKSELLKKIAQLIKDKKIKFIKDLRDETDRKSYQTKGKILVRIVIVLKKGANPQKILNHLFQATQLQSNFYVNMVALVNCLQPTLLSLKSILQEYLKHRQLVIRARTKFDLEKTQERIHILEGLKIALDKIDLVIQTIKKSTNREAAQQNLINKFKLTIRQANAILEMKLHRLAKMEYQKIEDELKDKLTIVKRLKKILKDSHEIDLIIQRELREVKDKFSDERRTQIIPDTLQQDFSEKDLIANEPALIVLTKNDYIKRLVPQDFHQQKRGGKGVIGMVTREEDLIQQLVTTTTLSDLYFFSNRGRVFQLKAYEIPTGSRTSRGQAIVNFLSISTEEKITSIMSLADLKNCQFLVMVTKRGIVKKVKLDAFANIRRSGLIAIKLKDNDRLIGVKPSIGKDDIILISVQGKAIKFSEKGIRSMGRTAAGVKGMRLKQEDYIIGMDIINSQQKELNLLTISAKGFGKKTDLKQYRRQQRGGTGIKTIKITDKTGCLVSARVIDLQKFSEFFVGDVVIISKNNQVIRFTLNSVPNLGRVTQGVRLMRFKQDEDTVASVSLI